MEKKPHLTLHELQAKYEYALSFGHRKTWHRYAHAMTLIVGALGKKRYPEDVFRADIADMEKGFHALGRKTQLMFSVGRDFYNWLQYHEYVPDGHNPFKHYELIKVPDFLK